MTETHLEPDLDVAEPHLDTALRLPSTFRFSEVPGHAERRATPPPAPSLGALSAFTGTFRGNGFNTIFRPNLGSPARSTMTTTPIPPTDNLLELNLTAETLSFAPALGAVPNRGEVQPDIFLNGVPYLQVITDVTTPAHPVGIHFEPGLWMSVPPTVDPQEGPTLARMASIPHGTTIDAQGTSQTITGAPTIPPVSITPPGFGPFPSQTAAATDTWRIPQHLTSFIAAHTITQTVLDDPNTVLRRAIAGQNISSTTTISVATAPATPIFGGGTDNIAFLLGNTSTGPPNARTVDMTATFWIETIEHVIVVPVFTPGERPLRLPAETANGGPTPTFVVEPPFPIREPIRIVLTSTQIQYSQTVMLSFNGLNWPHVSVATLVPAGPVPVPPSVWESL